MSPMASDRDELAEVLAADAWRVRMGYYKSVALTILTSDWLAVRDARVREQAAREALLADETLVERVGQALADEGVWDAAGGAYYCDHADEICPDHVACRDQWHRGAARAAVAAMLEDPS